MRSLHLFVAVLGAALAAGAAAPATAYELTILHTNDVHARIEPANRFGATCSEGDLAQGACWGGAARLAGTVREIRSQMANVVLLDAGDQFQGTLFYNRYKGLATAELMNLVGYDAMAVGNHEFDDGPAVLAAFEAALAAPLLSANLVTEDEPALAGRIPGHAVLERGGRRIGVIGLTTEETAYIARPGPTVRFIDAATAAGAAAARLAVDGIDIVVLLTHVGYGRDRELARTVRGVDVVVGGHSHSVLGDGLDASEGPYPTVEQGVDGQPVLVVQAFSWSRYLGRLDVEFDPVGVPVGWRGRLIPLDATASSDPDVEAAVARLAVPLSALRAEVVGETRDDLPVEDCRAVECRMGNLVADAMLEAVAGQDIQIAIQNGGGLRAGIPKGPVTRAQVMETLPFGNTLATFRLGGVDLKTALENAVSRVGAASGSGRFPQVAGLRYVYDTSRPAGRRLTSVEVRAPDGGFRLLDPTATYGIVTNDYLRRGGDEYTVFAEKAIDPYDHGPNLAEVVADYIARRSPVATRLGGRIHRTGG